MHVPSYHVTMKGQRGVLSCHHVGSMRLLVVLDVDKASDAVYPNKLPPTSSHTSQPHCAAGSSRPNTHSSRKETENQKKRKEKVCAPLHSAHDADLTLAELTVQNLQGWASIQGTRGGTAAELEARRQRGTVSICKGDCLPGRGWGPAAAVALVSCLVSLQAVHDVLSAERQPHLLCCRVVQTHHVRLWLLYNPWLQHC